MDVAEYIRRKQKQQNNAKDNCQPRQDTTQPNTNNNVPNDNTKQPKNQKKQQQKTTQEPPKNNNSQNIDMQAAYNRYSQMNEEQLMQELFKVGSVSSGQVSAQSLDNFYNTISGRLSPEQAARMKDLISQLKRS